jgi:hypothetical protein
LTDKLPALGHNNGPPFDEATVNDLAVEIEREKTPDELALANTPLRSRKFEIEGMASLADAFADPAIGKLFEDFHDVLIKAKDDPRQYGFAMFMLAYELEKAGYHLQALPTSPEARDFILSRFNQVMGRDYLAADRAARRDRGRNIKYLPTVYVSKTIAGRRQLLKESRSIRRTTAGLFKHENAGPAEFEAYAEAAEKRIMSAADRYDPARGAKLLTFVYPGLAGAWKDFCKRHGVRGGHLAGMDTIKLPADDYYSPLHGEPPPEGRVITNFKIWNTELQAKIRAAAKLTPKEGLVFDNLLRDQPVSWQMLAQLMSIKPDYLYVIKSRMQAKLRPVLLELGVVRLPRSK